MITGQKPILKSKQGQFQIVDIVQLMGPVTKMAKQIVHGDRIPSIVREAFRVAQEERPGAVLLELPEDIAAEATTTVAIEPHERYYAVAGDAVLSEAVKIIRAAERPLLLIGAGANRKTVRQAISRFIDSTGIPFFNTQMGKGVVDERHGLFLGTAALSNNDYVHCAVDRADLVINVGHDVVEKPPFFMEHGGKKVVHVNFKSAVVDEVYFPQVEVVGDIALSLERLGVRLGHVDADFDYFMRVKKEVDMHIKEGADDPRYPIIPQRIIADIRKAMPDDGIIALDNGMYKVWFARNYKAYEPNTILLDNALATMGAGLPSAMMAAQLCPERRVMAICGDGGFMMNSQELETAIRLGLNLVVTILNDNSYGMIRWKQAIAGFEDWGLEFGNPDFVKYAESYGATGHRIEATEDFLPTINSAFEAGGVHLIEVPIDYVENTRILIEELAQKACLL
jgi:acetolactate synthase-1/2/3 large subunit